MVDRLRTSLPEQPEKPLKGAERIFKSHWLYEEKVDQQRAQLLQVACYVIFAGALIALAVSFNGSERLMAYGAIYLAFSLLAILLLIAKRLRVVSMLFLLVIDLQIIAESSTSGQDITLPLMMILTLALAGYLLGLRAIFYTGLLNIVFITVFTFLSTRLGSIPVANLVPFLIRSAAIQIAGSIIVWAFFKNIYSWVDQAKNNESQMITAVRLSENMTRSTNLQDLLQSSIDIIKDTLIYQYIQVFLLDEEGAFARIEAGTGDAGDLMLAQGHAVIVGSDTIVGQCAELGKTITCNEAVNDSRFTPVDMIEGSRSEAALPLVVNDRVIGVLDIFCNQKNRFTEETIHILSIISAQLAASIDKFDLVNQLQSRISENEQLLDETQKNLSQIEEMASRMTLESWKQYLNLRSRGGVVGFTLMGDEITANNEWSSLMEETFTSERDLILREADGKQFAGIPLRVRGETIGVFTIENQRAREWSDNELEILEELGERLATAIDNTRLYEQASLLAGREQVINQVSQDIQKATSLEQVLQSSLTELGNILGASKGIVRIHSKAGESPTSKDV